MRRTRVAIATLAGMAGVITGLIFQFGDGSSDELTGGGVTPPNSDTTTSSSDVTPVSEPVVLPETSTSTSTVEPNPICEDGWILAEDRTCVNPHYYDDPPTNSAPTEYVVPGIPFSCQQEDDCYADFRRLSDGSAAWVIVRGENPN